MFLGARHTVRRGLAVAAASVVVGGLGMGTANADTPPSGCGYYVSDTGYGHYRNCGIYRTLIYIDMAIVSDDMKCVPPKSNTTLGLSVSGGGLVRDAWATGICET